jgi:GT2 family glycosyltransferase
VWQLVERKVVELSAAWVRVIIVNHNAGPLLQNCIDALAVQSLDCFEAIIVDNDSSDGSAKALRLPDNRFQLRFADANLGFRLALRGERCVQVRRAEVKHFGSVSAAEDSDFFVFHSQRNRLWVLAKNVPSPLLWLVAGLQILVLPVTVFRRGMGKWRVALKGVAAGLRGLPAVRRRRREVQSGRLVSSRDIARMLVWDPRKALRHAPKFLTARFAGASQAAKDV